MIQKLVEGNPEAVVKRAFWLAWQACGGPLGMGMFQDNPNATEDGVWDCVREAWNYPGGSSIMQSNRPGEAHADYVFGRMMKLHLKWGKDWVEVPEPKHDKPRPDYQAWCRKYPTINALVEAANVSLKQ